MNLLRRVIGELLIPAAVASEIEAGGRNCPAAVAIHGEPWIRIVDSGPSLPELSGMRLGSGELSVLSIAFTLPGAVAVLDDLAARKAAASLQIPVRGSLGICLVAKQRGLISSAGQVIADLLEAGLYLHDSTLQMALSRVGEDWP
jgi:predicted nucleic acid-binding protein